MPGYEANGTDSVTIDWYAIVPATIIRKLCVLVCTSDSRYEVVPAIRTVVFNSDNRSEIVPAVGVNHYEIVP